MFTAALSNQFPSDHEPFAPDSMPVVLPEMISDAIPCLFNEGPEAVLQQFPALRGHEQLLQEILENEAGIADLEGRTADLKDKADELSARVKEILEAAPEGDR